MSIEVKDLVGTVTVTVHYNATTEEPELGVDVDVQSEVFPAPLCLQSLASACRKAADAIEQQRASLVAGKEGP